MVTTFDNLASCWEANLVCPSCKGPVKIMGSLILCKKCRNTFSITNGVPCFITTSLSEHQKSELESLSYKLKRVRMIKHFYNQAGYCYKWALRWINNKTINRDTKIICIGGAYLDDLPHIRSNFKFNIDHLVHEYVKIAPEIAKANVKHIASVSENLPFKNNYADIVYSRNSLDHVCNPIKTLVEINRILKPDGRFYLSVYYNSNFIDSSETTIIDDEFINTHLKNLFDIEWLNVCLPEEKRTHNYQNFPFLTKNGLEWLYAVCKKKEDFSPYNIEALKKHESLTSNLHAAVFYDQRGEYRKAPRFFQVVINSTPLLSSDKMRILYSKIRYFALKNRQAFKNLFNEFKSTNNDPFWWKIVIESAWPFMKDELRKELSLRFSADKRVYLENHLEKCIKKGRLTSLIKFLRRRPALYIIAKSMRKWIKSLSPS